MQPTDANEGKGRQPFPVRRRSLRNALSGGIAFLSMATLMIYVAFVSVNVIARYVFNAPLHWIPDLGEILIPFALSLSFPAAAMNGSHLSIQFLGDLMGPRAFRMLEIGARVFTAGLMAIITWKMTEYAIEMHDGGRTTVQFGIRIWPVWAGVALGFALSLPGMLLAPLGTASDSIEERSE